MLILEGYMDVIAAHQHGVSSLWPRWAPRSPPNTRPSIKRYSKDTILMFDADNAGNASCGLPISSWTPACT